jgi:hypothetical protein
MRLPPRRLLGPGFAALLLGTACQSHAIARGDAAFRRGDYLGAWHAYMAAGDPAADERLAARLARTRWFLIEDGLRTLLSSGHEKEALALIPQLAAAAPPDRAPELDRLAQRGRDLVGMHHTRRAEGLIEAGESEEALRELALALSWNPEDELAANLFEMTDARLRRDRQLGDEFYFEGMDHLRHGSDLRARTSFHHAATLLGPDSRADARFVGLTADLAAASRAEARTFLDADMLGPAFFSIRSAERLEPEHPETLALVERLQAKVSSENALLAGDLAIRGGRQALVEELLAELRGWDVAAHRDERLELERRGEELALDLDYRRARALELDEQVVRAAATYRGILERGRGFGWADSELRLAQLEERIALAAASYAAALRAEADGDLDAYAAALAETVRAAGDYEDALARFAALRAAAAQEAGSGG